MNNYLNFFSPQTVSVLYCLFEACKRADSGDAVRLTEFCIQKIIRINQDLPCNSNQQFEAELLSLTDDLQLLAQYREVMERIDSLNAFYRFFSQTLKSLRVMKTSRAEQGGNIIELFLRRLGIYFQKIDFHELVGLFTDYLGYKKGIAPKRQLNDFAVSRRLESLKFGLENYSMQSDYAQTKLQLEQMQEFDHNFKAFYLRSLNEAQGGRPLESTDSMHKYFDKSLCNLFQERSENNQQANNVNHCILSLAYMNLKLGFVDESLKSISEGLRISQNNSDEQSINHCIIYLYRICALLGMHSEQTLLTEHAITHCLNLNNTLLMLFSCLSFSELEKHHDCNSRHLDPQKNRLLGWTDALHFAKKKIYSNFENSCKTIFHTERNLTIPVFLHKLAVSLQIPQLKGLLMKGVTDDPVVNQLDKFKLTLCDSDIQKTIHEAKLSDYRGEDSRRDRLVHELSLMTSFTHEPADIIKIWAFRNLLLISTNKVTEAYESCQRLISFCRNKGFVKAYLLSEQLNIARIQLLCEDHFEALAVIETVLAGAEQYQLTELFLRASSMKAGVHLEVSNVSYPLQILKKVEESGQLDNVSIECQALFYETKANVFQKIAEIFRHQGRTTTYVGIAQECQMLYHQIDSLLMKSVKLQLQLFNFREVARLCRHLQQFVQYAGLHSRQPSLVQTIDYLDQVFRYMRNLNIEYGFAQATSSNLSGKIQLKLQHLLNV